MLNMNIVDILSITKLLLIPIIFFKSYEINKRETLILWDKVSKLLLIKMGHILLAPNGITQTNAGHVYSLHNKVNDK